MGSKSKVIRAQKRNLLVIANASRPPAGVNSDSLTLGVRDWTHCAQDRQSWKDLLQQALTKYWL
jgi:hypothetical protein